MKQKAIYILNGVLDKLVSIMLLTLWITVGMAAGYSIKSTQIGVDGVIVSNELLNLFLFYALPMGTLGIACLKILDIASSPSKKPTISV
jgi:hypothetical protein